MAKGIPDSTEEMIKQLREENKKIFQDFLEGEGKLPAGFSPFQDRGTDTGTPFDAYLDSIEKTVDALFNRSEYDAWYRMDASLEINAAATAISAWAARHREMAQLLSERCHIEHTYIMPPFDDSWSDQTMIVLEDRQQFASISEESLQRCKSEGISFCVMLSDHELYDLIENTAKTVQCQTYPNYHDETHAEWTLR